MRNRYGHGAMRHYLDNSRPGDCSMKHVDYLLPELMVQVR